MPIYEYMCKCKCKKIVSTIMSVENRNKDITHPCDECGKVKAKRIFSKPLIKVYNGHFSDFKDSDVLGETELWEDYDHKSKDILMERKKQGKVEAREQSMAQSFPKSIIKRNTEDKDES